MITAVDTNVLLDLLTAHPRFGRTAVAAMRRCQTEGRLVACEVVWAELSGMFPAASGARDALSRLEVSYSPLDADTAIAAGRGWRAYRERGGRRTRIVSDFLIGAHALLQADRLLTRDRGFYRTYFRRLTVLEPGAS